MDFSWIAGFWPTLLEGLVRTISLLAISVSIGIFVAIGVALALASPSSLLRSTARCFTTTIRGTPLLVQLYIFYYGLGTLFATTPAIRSSMLWPYLRDGYWYVAISLVISISAYWGELIYGGLKAVPKGQLEAARAFAMPYTTLVRRIWLPYALRLLVPNLTNDCILVLKATSLASTVAVVDLLGAANQIRTTEFLVYEPLLLVAGIYAVLSFLIGTAEALVERTMPRRTA